MVSNDLDLMVFFCFPCSSVLGFSPEFIYLFSVNFLFSRYGGQLFLACLGFWKFQVICFVNFEWQTQAQWM